MKKEKGWSSISSIPILWTFYGLKKYDEKLTLKIFGFGTKGNSQGMVTLIKKVLSVIAVSILVPNDQYTLFESSDKNKDHFIPISC